MTEQAGTRPAVERVTPPLLLVRMANPVLRRLLASPLHRVASRQLLLLPSPAVGPGAATASRSDTTTWTGCRRC